MQRLLSLLAWLACTAAAADESRYQKLTAQGAALPPHLGPWACIVDRQTGLIWENKTDNEGTHLDAATYSWFDAASGTGKAKSGSCINTRLQVIPCDSSDLIAQARREGWCQRSDWRLPSTAELQGLLFDTGFIGNPRIATGFFPHTGRFPYWSADLRKNARSGYEARLVHFGSGQSLWLPTSAAARIRLVAGPQR
ncbi:MAG: DUF1566 domain-containing protein [Chitinimonas sp.]|nr:DUF1566 domain-containing protein [Chitinimonas sp.]